MFDPMFEYRVVNGRHLVSRHPAENEGQARRFTRPAYTLSQIARRAPAGDVLISLCGSRGHIQGTIYKLERQPLSQILMGGVMSEPNSIKYRAFLSYSHADTPSAKKLHSQLERYFIDPELTGKLTGMGPVPPTLRPIFRDRDEFTAGDALAAQTLAALDQSAALIVLCSPASAKSSYVNEEVRLFKWRHPGRPVIPVIADIETVNPELDCFPHSLRFDVADDGLITDRPANALAADLREAGDGEQLVLAKVTARLVGLQTDDIFRRAQREQRRRLRRWIAGLMAVAVMMAGLAVLAEFNRREAVRQRNAAERNFAVAKQGADALIFDIAQSLRNQEGMRTETVRKILGSAEDVIGKLVASTGKNADLQRSQAAMLIEFADTYATQGDSAKQSEAVQKSLAILDSLLKEDPANTALQANHAVALSKAGDVLFTQGRHQDALALFQEALTELERLADGDRINSDLQHDVASAHDRIANVELALGRKPDALTSYETSRAILERIAPADRGNAVWQRDLCVTYNKAGNILVSDSNFPEALLRFRKCLEIMEPLAKADPGDARWQHDIAITHDSIGSTLVKSGNRPEALASFKSSQTIMERLANADPDNTDRQHDLAVATERLADATLADGKPDAALAMYSANLTRIVPIRDRDPSNIRFQTFVATTLRKSGDILLTHNNPSDALEKFQQSAAIFEHLAAGDANSAELQHDFSVALSKAGEAHEALGQQAEALKSYEASRAAIELFATADQSRSAWRVEVAIAYGRAAGLLVQMDKTEEATDHYRKARALMVPLVEASPGDPKLRTYLDTLNNILAALGG